MPKTYYVVCQRSYEYNDEVYQASDGFHPTVIYESEEKAQQECFEKNIAFLTGNETSTGLHIIDTQYCLQDLFNTRTLDRKLPKDVYLKLSEILHLDDDYSDRNLHDKFNVEMRSLFKSLSKEHKQAIIESMHDRTYEVCEVINGEENEY